MSVPRGHLGQHSLVGALDVAFTGCSRAQIRITLMPKPPMRLLPRPLVVALALALVGMGAGIALAATSSPGPFTGCLSKSGAIKKVATSTTTPLKPCAANETQITFSYDRGPKTTRWNFDFALGVPAADMFTAFTFEPGSHVRALSAVVTLSDLPANCAHVTFVVHATDSSTFDNPTIASWNIIDTSGPLTVPATFLFTQDLLGTTLSDGRLFLESNCVDAGNNYFGHPRVTGNVILEWAPPSPPAVID